MKTIEHLEKIIAYLSKSGLCNGFFNKAKNHLDTVSDYLQTSHIQTVLFALLLENFGQPVCIKVNQG